MAKRPPSSSDFTAPFQMNGSLLQAQRAQTGASQLSLGLASILPCPPMRLLLDVKVKPFVLDYLKAKGFDAVHARAVKLGKATDHQFITRAHADRRLIVTHDDDFLDFDNYPLTAHRSRIVLPSFKKNQRNAMMPALEAALDHMSLLQPVGMVAQPLATHYSIDGFVTVYRPDRDDPHNVRREVRAPYKTIQGTNAPQSSAMLSSILPYSPMRFFADQNVKPVTLDYLKAKGYDVVHAEEIGMRHAKDPEIFMHAYREKRVLLSHDNDFFDFSQFPLSRYHSRIQLPPVDNDRDTMIPRLKAALDHITLIPPAGLIAHAFAVHYARDGSVTVHKPDAEDPYVVFPAIEATYVRRRPVPLRLAEAPDKKRLG